MNKFSASVGVMLLLFVLLPLSGISQGFLKTEGTQIVNETGEEVIFRGIGLGGWMLQEGYMLKTGGPQYKIENRIEALIGAEKKQEFYDAWLAGHMQKIDVDSMASWGFNAIRLPMHYKLFTPPIEEEPVAGEITWLDEGFDMTDQLLEWCKTNNIYLILDLHAAPGGQGENADINDYDPTKPSLWESEANREKMVALWKRLAERYADEPMIGGYDIINEPNWGFQNHASDPNGCAESQNTMLWALQKEITEAIREVDQNHIIIIEGNCWGNNYAGLPELWDDNLVISFHKYWNGNEKNAIQGMLNLSQEHNVPLYLGESGENANTWFTDAISLVEENGISWSWWPLKKMGINNPLEVVVNPGYQKILDFWNGNGPEPTEEEAYQALMQLAEDVKLENNIFHKDVVDAMIRQPHSQEAIPFEQHVISATEESIIYAVNYDLGRHNIAYHDAEYTNTTGNAGGLAWNQGYAYRNDGVDIEACEDETTNGYNVGWIETDEWLQYTVNVEEDGIYTLKIRSASSGSEGKLSLYANGTSITESIALPNTGGYQTWETTTVEDVYLKSGENAIKVNIDAGGFNLNYLSFMKQDAPVSEQPKMLEGSINHGEKVIRLVYNQPFSAIPADHGFVAKVNDAAVTISEIHLKEGESQTILMSLETPVAFGDKITVSYSGTGVTTSAGTALAAFSDMEITVFTEAKVLHVPGKIQMEDFAVNHGFEFEATEDTGGGQNAGYTDPGDYFDFMITVDQAGYYKPEFRVASLNTGGALKLQLVDEEDRTEALSTINFEKTGGWQTWKTVSGSELYLEAGLHTLRVLSQGATFNINWLSLSYLYEEQPLGVNDDLGKANVLVYPNPSSGTFRIKFSDNKKIPEKVLFYDLLGRKLWAFPSQKGTSEYHIKHPFSKGICFLVFEMDGRRLTEKLVIN